MNDYSQPYYVDVIICPFPYHTVDLADTCYSKVGPVEFSLHLIQITKIYESSLFCYVLTLNVA